MLVRVLTLLALSFLPVHAEEKERERTIYPDKKSTAAILSISTISGRTPVLKVRFTNNNPHPVEVFLHEGVIERKKAEAWENLWTAFQDSFSGKDMKPAPAPVVRPKETVELEFTPTSYYEEWKKGDILRFSFIHHQRLKDFPNRDHYERMRVVTTKPHKSEQDAGGQAR